MHRINASSGLGAFSRVDCPNWQDDETSLLFVGTVAQTGITYVLRYTLSTNHLDSVFNGNTEIVYSPITASVGGTHIAFTSAANTNEGGLYSITLVYPRGQTQQILQPFFFASSPLWSPPTLDNLRAKLTVCVTDHGIYNALSTKLNNQLGAFINQVQAQSGKKIDTLCANQMIAIATYLQNHP